MDEHGNVLETANNSDGIYSKGQDPSLIIIKVESRTQYEDTNTPKVTIRCPGYVNLHQNNSILF